MGNWFRPCTPCPSGKAVISASKFVIIFHIQEKEQPSFAHTAGTKRHLKGPHRRKDARRLEAASERQSRPPEISRNRCGYGGAQLGSIAGATGRRREDLGQEGRALVICGRDDGRRDNSVGCCH